MTLTDLEEGFIASAKQNALSKLVADKKTLRIAATSLPGSAAAMMIAGLPKRKAPTLVVGDSPDDAGYLYHDLSRLAGEEAVLIFPSAYKRDIKYGRVDPPSEILRTEALARWHSDSQPRFVVTSPEALAERVAPRDDVDHSTLRMKVGQEIYMKFDGDRLNEIVDLMLETV